MIYKVCDQKKLGIHNIVNTTYDSLSDLLYISERVHIPEKENIQRCYWTDFRLLSNQDAMKIAKKIGWITIEGENMYYDFFVYNDRKREIVPFKKNDYLMNEKEYMTYDGEKYIYIDNDGNIKEYMRVEGNVCTYYTYNTKDNQEIVLYTDIFLDNEQEENGEDMLIAEKRKNKKE